MQRKCIPYLTFSITLRFCMMKKLALLFVLAVMLCPAFQMTASAEKPVYTLNVNKSNGGFLALFNLYGTVNYAESQAVQVGEFQCVNATLTCTGSGFLRCRVPSESGYWLSQNQTTSCRITSPGSFVTTINQLIENSEQKFEKGTLIGKETKKVAPDTRLSTSSNKYKISVYNSSWKYDEKGNGSMTIQLFLLDPKQVGM